MIGACVSVFNDPRGPARECGRLSAIPIVSLLVACGQTGVSTDDSESVPATFEQVFEIEDVFELQEDPGDSIAELGAFTELEDGGFVVGDNLLPRIRRYAEHGRLVAAFGRFGDGPFEFRWINSVAETASGAIVVPTPYSRT